MNESKQGLYVPQRESMWEKIYMQNADNPQMQV